MNESTAKQFTEILESIEHMKSAGVGDSQARFAALVKMFALILAKQDYIADMLEYSTKEKERKEIS